MARYQFKFWLDCSKDGELLLAESIDDLKRKRSFASTIRDALRLILDLRAGRIDLLLEFFPFVVDAIRPPESDKNTGSGAGVNADILPHIERLEKLILSSNGNAGSGQAVKPLPDFELPVGSIFAVANTQEKKASAGEARAAFTGGMGNLFGGDDDDLWDD